MPRMTGGDAIVDSLLRHGIDTLFGLPGVQMYGLFDALARNANRIRVINDGDAAGTVPSVVDDYDEDHIDPEAIGSMVPPASSDDDDKITWAGPHTVPALDELTFEYSGTVIGTFSGGPYGRLKLPLGAAFSCADPQALEKPVDEF